MEAQLLVGLGNPGSSYAGHRHNAGFMAIDALRRAYGLREEGKKYTSLLARGEIAGTNIIALKPQTFMNRSGEAVLAAATFYKIPPQRVIVFHDDLDVAFGRIKVKQGGGHGGHNGLRDIDRVIGSEYVRVRLGIGRPERSGDEARYVLSDFTPAETPVLSENLQLLSQHLPLLLAGKPALLTNALAIARETRG